MNNENVIVVLLIVAGALLCTIMLKHARLKSVNGKLSKLQDEHASLRTRCDSLASEYRAVEEERTALEDCYKPIIDLNQEVSRLEGALAEIKESYSEKRSRYEELVRAVAAFDEKLELAELGFYEPHFDFDTSEKYKEAIQAVKSEQKQMVRDKRKNRGQRTIVSNISRYCSLTPFFNLRLLCRSIVR